MGNTTVSNSIKFENSECPFTELFSLLMRYENLPNGFPSLVYQSDELEIINQHIDNAMNILLQGLQGVGNLMSMITEVKNNMSEDINNLGHFISGISNLTEALNSLRLDSGFVLKQRKETDY